MPGRTGPASIATLAPSLTGSSAVADAVPAVGWPANGWPTDDGLADDWPGDEGPADDGPGLVVSWTGGVTIDQVLSAVHRYQRHRAGLDLPAWGEAGHAGKPDDPPARDAAEGPQDDGLGDEAAAAAPGDGDRGHVLSVAALGGHAIMAPGPDLAGWLACSKATARDDAALVTSITAWRKVTSWAQAQELAAVAELARRRRVAGAVDAGGQDCDRAADAGDRDPVADTGRDDHDPVADDHDPVANVGRGDRDPVSRDDCDPIAELEAGFAPNEVALALTLTQGGAEHWMDLAVSLTRRLPATLAALAEGAIDLNRAKLIDQYTCSLDAGLAQAVERRVLARAEHQTTGQLRASLQRAVLAADPAAAERRRQEAQQRAWVALFGDHDGTASLSGRCLPAAQAAAAWARICAMAKAMEAAGAGGGMDLLRARVFVGLLLGTLPLIPPSDGGPEDAGPAGEGPEDAGPTGDRPEDRSPDDGGPEGNGRENGGPGDGGSEDGWPDGDGAVADEGPHTRTPRPADPPGEDLRPLPAWPPLPLPGATPTPGCARPARASPAGSQDRRGPPGSPRLAGRAVLCVPWRTLAGWTCEPGELSRIGPVTAGVARDLALAAAADVTCEWKVIVVGRSGRAVAVAKVLRMRAGARRRGGSRRGSEGPGTASEDSCEDMGPGVVGRITLTIPAGLLHPADRPVEEEPAGSGPLAEILAAALRTGAKAFSARRSRTAAGGCTHEEASPGYRVPDPMRALVEARDQTCGFPTCRQPAWRCEQDHTIAHRLGGPTCPCNLSPECSRHHHLKHLPSWRLDQPRPGVRTWTTPARLTHTVTSAPYPA